MPVYAERLTPPPVWFLLAGLLVLTCGVSVGAYAGPVWGAVAVGVALAAAVGVLAAAAVPIVVTDAGLRVGRAFLERDYLGPARALDTAATTRRSGPEADARSYLVLRPYVPTAVEVAVDDADDPVPFWLVSTRRPTRLAAAVTAVRAPAPGPRTRPPR